MQCAIVAEERIEMKRLMNDVVEGWQEMKEDKKVVLVLTSEACRNGSVRRALQIMWER